ncbi:MAG: S1 family peptidase [Pyrinomonadaceae bacterium]
MLFGVSFLAMSPGIEEPRTVSAKTIETIQKGILPIVCTQVGGESWEPKRIVGTGFLINTEGHFLTAAHVVLDWEQTNAKFGPCFAAVFIPAVPWSARSFSPDIRVKWIKFTDCRYNGQIDVAVCKLLKNPFDDPEINKHINALAFGSVLTIPDGSAVAFTGFPLDFHVPVTSQGHVAAYAAADRRLVIDKSAWPGASGSPVYDTRGRVIGIVTETGLAEGAGLTYSRPIDYVKQFLANEKIATVK